MHAGDKKAWPLYMSIGNIKSSVRNKPSNNAWILIGYLPITKFHEREYNTMLSDRLFHQCLKIILIHLVKPGVDGVRMVDSVGDERNCFPRIAAYIADNPEQALINVASSGSSPMSTATKAELGNSHPTPPRTRTWILSRIAHILRRVDPDDLKEYKAAAKARGLNGVHKPFWEDIPGYETHLCLAPDILHGGHRFLRDHILQWIVNMIGFPELDRRLKLIQPCVGLRYFSKGIGHLTQWTGREDRELQRVLLAVLHWNSKIDKQSMRSLRAIQDFLYLAQYRSHSRETLGYLRNALNTFHATKAAFIRNGSRRGKRGVIPHFNIPKLGALHAYLTHIPQMGSSPQYSSEITETLHQTMAKAAYKVTNRKNYPEQMCRYLDRSDKLSYMDEFLLWAQKEKRRRAIEEELQGASDLYREIAMRHINAASDRELEVPLTQRRQGGRRKGERIWHTLTPHYRSLIALDACRMYHLSIEAFSASLTAFIHPPPPERILKLTMDVWTHIRITIPTVQEVYDLTQTRTIQALPPSPEMPHGRFNCVLIHDSDEAGEVGVKGKSHHRVV